MKIRPSTATCCCSRLRTAAWIYFVTDSIMRLIWVMRFPSREVYSPQLCSGITFFSLELCRQPSYSDWFQRLWGSRKQASPYFQLLMNLHRWGFLSLKISILCTFVFHNISLLRKKKNKKSFRGFDHSNVILMVTIRPFCCLCRMNVTRGRVFSSV